MIPASTIARIAVLGLSEAQAIAVAEMLAEVEKATEAKCDAAIEARRANDRERKDRQRHGTSREVTGRHETGGDKKTPVLPENPSRAPAFFVGEEVYNIPPNDPSDHIPQPAKRNARNAGTRLPDDFAISDANRAFAAERGMSPAQIADAFDEFVLYWRALPGPKGRKLDWEGTFRNRLREVATRLSRLAQKGQNPKLGGFSPSEARRAVPAGSVLVSRDSPEWAAWTKYTGKTPPASDKSDGWYFPSRWPPNAGKAA